MYFGLSNQVFIGINIENLFHKLTGHIYTINIRVF